MIESHELSKYRGGRAGEAKRRLDRRRRSRREITLNPHGYG